MEDLILLYVDLSLVRAADSLRLLSAHRLIQTEFRHYLGKETRLVRWREAAVLLHASFPQQRKGFTLFNE